MSNQRSFFLSKKILPLFISLFLLIFLSISSVAKETDTEILYTVQLKKLHPDVRSSIVRLAPVTDSITKSFIGKIESVSFTPHRKECYSTLYDRVIEAPHPFFYDATITVRASAVSEKSGYVLDAFRLTRGVPVHFFTAEFRGVGECTEIYESEALS